MASPEQHEALYAALRAKVLARHFAISRWFRANHLSLWNVLEEPAPEATKDLDPEEIELLRRWNVVDHGRENPLLEAGKLFTALAVEFSLGYRESATPLVWGIETVTSLFPIRMGQAGWVPVSSPASMR